jgi:hypothetical protein
VFGVNCASAAFDTPGHPSFVELQVEKPDGGAVAGFGDTRNSPSFPNNHMALGFFDALFPDLEPTFGSPVRTRRLGDVLLSGKAFMASQEGIDWQGAGDTYYEHLLYGLLGDPSLQMWADPPRVFDPGKILSGLRVTTDGFVVDIRFPGGPGDPPPFGTIVTLFHDGDAIGRGVVGAGGTLTIRPDIATSSRNLTVSFQQDGTLPAQDTVDNQSPKEQTSLTLNTPDTVSASRNNTFSGQLSPAFAGAHVRVVYTPGTGNPQSAFTHTASTNGSGAYSDVATFGFNGNQSNAWQAQAFFDGDGDHASSSSSAQSFTVGP